MSKGGCDRKAKDTGRMDEGSTKIKRLGKRGGLSVLMPMSARSRRKEADPRARAPIPNYFPAQEGAQGEVSSKKTLKGAGGLV